MASLLKIITASLLIASIVYSKDAAEVGPWTDWYKKPLIAGILKLKDMRKSLERNNLFYLSTDDAPKVVSCDAFDLTVRQVDGTCTDLFESEAGKSGTLLGRNINPEKLKSSDLQDSLDPDPRQLSLEFMTRKKFQPAESLNFLSAAWIQFMVHDWFAHEELGDQRPFFLPLSENDPLKKTFGQSFMTFTFTKPVKAKQWEAGYINKVTHWWDGSQIYGSDLNRNRELRTFAFGQMKLDNGFLPLSSNGEELTGANPNWWVGLGLFHTIFVKEHNSIAMAIHKAYPEMNDEQIYQRARLVTAATMAKIHALEFSQVELDNPATRLGTKVNWYGFLTALRDGSNSHSVKVAQDYEKLFPNSATLTGIIAGELRTKGVPFSQTTDLSSVYRYHSFIPDTLDIVDEDGRFVEAIPIENTRLGNSYKLTKKFGAANLFRSFGQQSAGAVTLNNYPKFFQELEVPVMGRIDLGALDIFRDRERSVPRYNEFRRQVGLKPLTSISQISTDADVVARLEKAYHGEIERVDLQIGLLAESRRAKGFVFGETQFQLISMMASRRLQADRFYTSDYNAKTYTQVGLDWVDRVTFKEILIRHYPELADSLKDVVNPFRNWPVKK